MMTKQKAVEVLTSHKNRLQDERLIQNSPICTALDMAIECLMRKNANKCVCCGDVIPEGRQVCLICERKA